MKFPVAIFSVLASSCAFAGSYATGGEVSLDIVGADTYAVHVFTNNGEFVVKGAGIDADILLVGGGGGGGAGHGGGGGAGGVVLTNLVLSSGAYQVRVGSGGAGAAGGINSDLVEKYAKNGEESVFAFSDGTSISAAGGGGGASGTVKNGQVGRDGASGGGGAGYYGNTDADKIPLVTSGGNGVVGQGFNGGCGVVGTQNHFRQWGGGGGGACAAGGDAWYDAASDTGAPGSGGDGLPCAITGKEIYYAGGGGGGCNGKGAPGVGGLGGGGSGNTRSGELGLKGSDGVDGFGGGGGGGGSYSSISFADGGNGGSGTVIVRYKVQPYDNFDGVVVSNAVVSRFQGEYVYTFRSNGVFAVLGASRVQMLLVGGGGGGGAGHGGGGGAGGFIETNLVLRSGSYSVSAGAGGAGAAGGIDYSKVERLGKNGEGSVFALSDVLSVSVAGGGGGGSGCVGYPGQPGSDGASGGGGAGYFAASADGTSYPFEISGGNGIDGQGFPGGCGILGTKNHFRQWGGGGGGAGGSGGDAWYVAESGDGWGAGSGGVGKSSSITGVEVYYGGGGGGGRNGKGVKGAGGLGGGGDGTSYSGTTAEPGADGTDGLGGGGGGGGSYSTESFGAGGKGGDGVVIIRCKLPPKGFKLILK